MAADSAPATADGTAASRPVRHTALRAGADRRPLQVSASGYGEGGTGPPAAAAPHVLVAAAAVLLRAANATYARHAASLCQRGAVRAAASAECFAAILKCAAVT
jgi:hypothetical protein